ncbi:hypothetical protein JFT33_03680 [Pseudomonas carnis]|uniref:hypothetical protein n=1 Tax=Pseudomonas carnis TaxID=2487355 RepID=UPI0018E6F2D4|nr:hypothetical protein [Pseudomonas carnis]MBJ2205690.1 hypothetical protein [Pseudomonas carnis]
MDHVRYTAVEGPIKQDRDLLPEDGDIAQLIVSLGYFQGFEIGNRDVASIEMFTSNDSNTEFAAIAVVILGEAIDIYAFPATEDAWHYLNKFVPTVKAISELSQIKYE